MPTVKTFLLGQPVISWPAKRIVPARAGRMPKMVFRNVDLPAPLAPMMVVTRSAAKLAERPRRTSISPYPETRSSTSSIRRNGREELCGAVAVRCNGCSTELIEIRLDHRYVDGQRSLRCGRILHPRGRGDTH